MKLLRRPLPASINTGRHVLRSMGMEVQEWGRYLYTDSKGEQKLQFA
jgi:hypothetical protein